jgi:hypothetical protein
MELTVAYLYNRIPIETHNINNRTFHHLKRHGWYNDVRTNRKFTMLNKRIEVNGKWYRGMIRFEYKGLNMDGNEMYTLSLPCPFIVTECEQILTIDGTPTWKDTKTYHGPSLKSVMGLLEAGVPSQVIQEVHDDLRAHVEYN